MTDTTTDTTPPTSREPGPGLWPSLAVLTVGLALVSWGFFQAFQSAFELLTVESFDTPGSQVRDLDPGEYEVYAQLASVDILQLDVSDEFTVPSLSDVTVTALDSGRTVPLTARSSAEALSRQNNVYELFAGFEITDSGRYEVSVEAPQTSRAVFGRSIESAFDRITGSLILAGIGGLMSILGTAMLIIGAIRRRRHRSAAGPTGGPGGVSPGQFRPPPSATSPFDSDRPDPWRAPPSQPTPPPPPPHRPSSS